MSSRFRFRLLQPLPLLPSALLSMARRLARLPFAPLPFARLLSWPPFALLPFVLLLPVLLLLGCNGNPPGVPAGPYTVTEIFDGDSFNLKAANAQTVRVRIAGIDAPEKSQPYAQKSKAALEALLASGPITLDVIKQDRFERWVAHVSVNNVDVGLRQVEDGWAWYFRRYKKDLSESMQRDYERAERQARADQRGLWAWSSPPEPPWKFRERNR
jgi:micrococcal nuclease